MPHETITFQIATNYLPRIALRLEYLHETINQACEESHPVIHHYALKNIIEILQLIEKPELKSRFLKELLRIEHALIKSNKDISEDLSHKLHTQIVVLSHLIGLFGEGIHQDSFLQIFRQTLPSHNQDCEMHPPQLQFWMEASPAERQRDLLLWLASLQPLFLVVGLYLELLRSTAEFDNIVPLNGFYQRPLPTKTSCLLILLRLDKSLEIVPRVQLGHYGLSLMFCEAKSLKEIRDTHTHFDLAICQI